MHDYLISIALGVIEGVTEFLPISSTAHIRLAQVWLFKLNPEDPFWKMYAVVIQLGAVLCLPTYFGRRLLKFVQHFPKGPDGTNTVLTHPLSLVMLAFFCTAAPALLLKKAISHNLENLTVIGAALTIGGAIMWAVDALFTKPRTLEMERMSIPQAIWIGLIQTLAALFPGTSRSMATIAAGQTAGLSRAAALEFSFFLSIPTMTVACLYDLMKSLRPGHDLPEAHVVMTADRWIVLIIGFVVSYIVALVVVAWFMNWVRRRGFVPFAIYRILIGLVVLTALRHVEIPTNAKSMESNPSPSYHSQQ